MPPKGSVKRQVQEPAEESPAKKKTSAQPPPKKTPTKHSTPKKAPETVIFTPVTRDEGGDTPVSITFKGKDAQAKPDKDGVYEHHLKLQAPVSFSVLKTIVLPAGAYEGHQAILVLPAKPFPFMQLKPEDRLRVYEHYFRPETGTGIALEAKRNDTRDLYARTYAGSSKQRVALLAASTAIRAEATPVLYAHHLRFDSTATLLDFLIAAPAGTRAQLTGVRVKAYQRNPARLALGLLAEAPRLRCLTLDAGVAADADPRKAAKVFWAEANKMLTALCAAREGDAAAAVAVLQFGKAALTLKDDDKKKQARPWDEEEIEEFREALRAKLK